jgi:hypothetical protein
LNLWFEPWAEGFEIAPGRTLTIVGRSEVEGRFEVERGDRRVVVYAWPGSTAVVYDGATALRTYPIPVPSIPAGMTMSGFMGTVFGGRPFEPPIQAPRKPWWQIW